MRTDLSSKSTTGLLTATLQDVPGGMILTLCGNAGLHCEPMETELLRVLAVRPPLLVIDLTGLDFLSSLGMGLIMSARRNASMYGGQVRLAGGNPLVLESLQRARLLDLFDRSPTVVEALATSQTAKQVD